MRGNKYWAAQLARSSATSRTAYTPGNRYERLTELRACISEDASVWVESFSFHQGNIDAKRPADLGSSQCTLFHCNRGAKFLQDGPCVLQKSGDELHGELLECVRNFDQDTSLDRGGLCAGVHFPRTAQKLGLKIVMMELPALAVDPHTGNYRLPAIRCAPELTEAFELINSTHRGVRARFMIFITVPRSSAGFTFALYVDGSDIEVTDTHQKYDLNLTGTCRAKITGLRFDLAARWICEALVPAMKCRLDFSLAYAALDAEASNVDGDEHAPKRRRIGEAPATPAKSTEDADTLGDEKTLEDTDAVGDEKPNDGADAVGNEKPFGGADAAGDERPKEDADAVGDAKPNEDADDVGDEKPDENPDAVGDEEPLEGAAALGDEKRVEDIDAVADEKPNDDAGAVGDEKPNVDADALGDGTPLVDADADGDEKPSEDTDAAGNAKPNEGADAVGNEKNDVADAEVDMMCIAQVLLGGAVNAAIGDEENEGWQDAFFKRPRMGGDGKTLEDTDAVGDEKPNEGADAVGNEKPFGDADAAGDERPKEDANDVGGEKPLEKPPGKAGRGRPLAQQRDEEATSDIEGELDLDSFCRASALLAKMRQLLSRLAALEGEDDMMACTITNMHLNEVKKSLRKLAVCHSCYIQKPSTGHQKEAGELWRGAGQTLCPKCVHGYQGDAMKTWPHDQLMRNSLRRHVYAALMTAHDSLESAGWNERMFAQHSKELTKLMQTLKPSTIKGQGFRVKAMNPLAAAGMLDRIKRRVSMEPEMKDHHDALVKALRFLKVG